MRLVRFKGLPSTENGRQSTGKYACYVLFIKLLNVPLAPCGVGSEAKLPITPNETSTDANFGQGRLTVFQLGTPQTKPLGQEQADELAVGEEITPPKTSRLLTEPV
jgi:hypothetical protein